MILGTAGHIDHGKTALVKALTGVDTDRLPEEKKRGITIDLGFAPLELDGIGTVGVVDVPGHEGFVRTMLAGATGINIGLLVVAADAGVMPQTREHLEILRLLGVPVPIVALTKSDLADEDWKSLVSAEIRDLVVERLGCEPQIIQVSVVTGDGIDALRAALAREFSEIAELTTDDLFRMPIDRVFTIRGTGTVVSGTIWSGAVRPGDTMKLLPSGKEARVRRVESHGAIMEHCGAGNRCAIALSNLAVEDISRGDVLVGGAEWRASTRIAAEVNIEREFLSAAQKGHIVHLHIGTSYVPARLRLPFADDENGSAYSIISLKEPVVARSGDRFVLRSASAAVTIGGGMVLDPFPARGSIKERISAVPNLEKMQQLLRFAGLRGVARNELPVRLGIPATDVDALIEAAPDIVIHAGSLYSGEAATTLESKLLALLRENEVNAPLTRGVSLSTARMMTRAAELFDLVVRRMSDRGELVVEDGLIRRTAWVPSLDETARKLSDAVLHDICSSGREPPSVEELVRKRGNKVPDLLRLLEGEGRLVKVETDRYYDAAVVKELVGDLRGRMTGGKVFPPSELREILGISRKYLIPFLEYCDRLGVTDRRAEGRVLRTWG